MYQFLHFNEDYQTAWSQDSLYSSPFLDGTDEAAHKKVKCLHCNWSKKFAQNGKRMAQFAWGSIHGPSWSLLGREGGTCRLADPILGFMLGRYYYVCSILLSQEQSSLNCYLLHLILFRTMYNQPHFCMKNFFFRANMINFGSMVPLQRMLD